MNTLSSRVAELLTGLDVPVYCFYPQSWLSLPVISWRESGNRELARADGRPHLAELTYTVDIWSDSPARNEALSHEIDRRMTAARLRRDYLDDLYDTRTACHHRSLRYRCVADGEGNIYQ